MDYFSDPLFVTVFTVVLLSRFLLPLTIIRWPLPGVVACLVLDAADQTIFQSFGYDPPFYQGYDKAMDVFYLGMAYIATLRNWSSLSAFAVSRLLFFYRQVGVVAFELSGVRALLLVFPNTFEYFFIAYEAVRARWTPTRLLLRGWIVVAAAIWVFVKLPQEYWIHIAQLDFTDTLQDYAWFGPLVFGGLAVILVLARVFVWPRLPGADHPWQLTAPPLPAELDTAAKRGVWTARHARVWSQATLEKSALVGLLLVIFASILSDMDIATWRILAWTATFVALNVVGELALARRGFSSEATVRAWLARTAANTLGLLAIDQLIYGSLPLSRAAAFAVLFSTLITAYDRYRPVYELRRLQAAALSTSAAARP
ncbi:MAG: hypothetical protein KDC46_11960 [Thermoleophilia bacterium]|nr:hypothetical protein [Thermoleophilia bacterium]